MPANINSIVIFPITLWGLRIFPLASGWVGVHSTVLVHWSDAWGWILLVHWCNWYDGCQWNIIYSTGISLVKCISLCGLKIFLLALGWVGVRPTCPLVRLVRLIPMEKRLFHWYSIGEMHLTTADLEYFRWLQAERGCILLVHWYDWYDWYQ